MSRMKRPTPVAEYPKSFLPRNVARAADAACEEVLHEDDLLRKFGIVPSAGRSR